MLTLILALASSSPAHAERPICAISSWGHELYVDRVDSDGNRSPLLHTRDPDIADKFLTRELDARNCALPAKPTETCTLILNHVHIRNGSDRGYFDVTQYEVGRRHETASFNSLMDALHFRAVLSNNNGCRIVPQKATCTLEVVHHWYGDRAYLSMGLDHAREYKNVEEARLTRDEMVKNQICVAPLEPIEPRTEAETAELAGAAVPAP